MKKRHKWYLVAGGIALLMLSLIWNTISVGWASGRVLEDGTNKPLANVMVVVLWQGLAFHGSSCFHVETGTTDKDGYYKISAWFISKRGFMLSNKYRSVIVYKEGYERSKKIEKEAIRLIPFSGTRQDRLEYLKRVVSASGCHSAGKSRKGLFSLYKALLEEAKMLAKTQDEKELVKWLRSIAASTWVATDENMTTREHNRLVEEYLKENPL